ncbi:hypothetical protein LINPERPRIM_LOCUS28031, partial [Linum perenne]
TLDLTNRQLFFFFLLLLLLTDWSIGRPANFPKVVTPMTEGRSTTSRSNSLMVISPEVVHQTDFSFC